MEYHELFALRKSHPAWRLLQADHAPLVVSFLHKTFIKPNLRTIAQSDLASKLEDELFQLRETYGSDAFPREAGIYLNDWTQNEKGWLRKFYPEGQDEAHFDLTPATEKAILWLESLTARLFVGTESRLMTVFELLRQIISGSEADVDSKIAELETRRRELDSQIKRIRAGELDLLDETALKDRFQQMSMLAKGLLGDFREVEHNFRILDRKVREQIATWEGHKGELLEKILGDRDIIADSDQGRSFRSFWEFIMSPQRQEEFSTMISQVLAMGAIRSLKPDSRLGRVHFDWLDAGMATQRTVARLSQQLRRFLDDRAFLENRRIMQIFQQIEVSAIELRQKMPTERAFMEIDEAGVEIELPMERPLYRQPLRPQIDSRVEIGAAAEIDTSVLFDQVIVDKTLLRSQIRKILQSVSQVTLGEVIVRHPLQQGLSELLAYMVIAGSDNRVVFDESVSETIRWLDSNDVSRCATVPRIIFNR